MVEGFLRMEAPTIWSSLLPDNVSCPHATFMMLTDFLHVIRYCFVCIKTMHEPVWFLVLWRYTCCLLSLLLRCFYQSIRIEAGCFPWVPRHDMLLSSNAIVCLIYTIHLNKNLGKCYVCITAKSVHISTGNQA